MADRNDLRYTPDGIRDMAHGNADEQNVQSTMLAEVAIAMHRNAEALEAQNEILREQEDE